MPATPEGNSPERRPPPIAAEAGSVRCPECGVLVPSGQLEAHRGQAHPAPRPRPARSAKTTLGTLLDALCVPRPDPARWAALETLARKQQGDRADGFLANLLSQGLARLEAGVRLTVLPGMADMLVGAGGARLLPLLAAEPEAVPRHLALLLAERLPTPLDNAVVQTVQPLLLDRRLPPDALQGAAVALLRTVGTEGDAATEVFRSLVAGHSKARSLDWLRRLEQQVGPSATLDALAGELENRLRMSCPRCGVELRRHEMLHHLWDQHRLILDGRRVREPWQVVEEWIAEYRRNPSAEFLERCRVLAQRIDPDNGEDRFQRLLLAGGVEDAEVRQRLLEEAAQQGASLCPHCYALVPVPREVPLLPLNVWHGRLSLRGYRVEVFDGGLFTRLEIETPGSAVYRGAEGGRLLTRKGGLVLLVGPFVVLALLFGFGLLAPALPPLLPVVLVLAMAAVVAGGVYLHWRPPRPATERAVDYAWTRLVPRLHAEGFSREDSAFVAGLALTSLEHGDPEVRATPFAQVLARTEKAVLAGQGVVEHLADLRHLALSEAIAAGEDPVELLATQVRRCLEGNLPLTYAQRLLAGWQGESRHRANLTRLRLLLCDRAFEAGFEVRNLIEAGRAAPALAAVLETGKRDYLAWLRLIWSLRSSRPWDRCGPAETAFDVAETLPDSPYLKKYPDLLLVQDTELPDAAALVVCARGVALNDELFTEVPREVEIVPVRRKYARAYEVRIGAKSFMFSEDPEVMVTQLERWFRYYFKDLAPQVPGVYAWQSPSVSAALRTHDAVACPLCHRAVLAHAGEVGVSLDAE